MRTLDKLASTFAHPHWQIASRASAAIIGGYFFTSAAIILLAALLPISTAEAVLGASLLSFTIYTLIIIWVYAMTELRKIWFSLLTGSVLMTGLGLLIERIQ